MVLSVALSHLRRKTTMAGKRTLALVVVASILRLILAMAETGTPTMLALALLTTIGRTMHLHQLLSLLVTAGKLVCYYDGCNKA